MTEQKSETSRASGEVCGSPPPGIEADRVGRGALSANHIFASLEVLSGESRKCAEEVIKKNHYSHSVPSGKSYYLRFGECLIVWSIPANKNIAKFILGFPGKCWELSRMWAPDGHNKNLLTMAISRAVRFIRRHERPDILVSYADPNVGHLGMVYRAASWKYHGQSEEARYYKNPEGQCVARRAFHSGKQGMKKSDIENLGYTEFRLPGKHRYVKPLSVEARRAFRSFNLGEKGA